MGIAATFASMIFSAFFGGLIGMVVLRVACRICNKKFGLEISPVVAVDHSFDVESTVQVAEKSDNPYAAPLAVGEMREPIAVNPQGIPSYGRALGISALFFF